MRIYSSVIPDMTLTSALNANDGSTTVSTTIQLSYGGWDVIASPNTLTLVIAPNTANEEIVKVIAHSNNSTTATILRGQEGTDGNISVTHIVGTVVRHMVTAADLREPHEHLNATTGVHGLPAGVDFVGRTNAQEVTNKTIKNSTLDGSVGVGNNTFSNIPAAAINGLSGTYALLASPNFSGTPQISGAAIATQSYTDGKLPKPGANTGIVVRNADNTTVARSIEVTGTGITITNANGVNGNPLITFTGGGGSGTVTSVGMTVPTGLTVTGSPVTTSGTLAVTYSSGYAIPTTAKQTNWDTAYDRSVGYYASAYIVGTTLSSDGAIGYTSENADSSGFHSNSTNTSRMTVPSNLGGKYKISASVRFSYTASAGNCQIYFMKNGVKIDGTDGATYISSSQTVGSASIEAIVPLIATDYIEVYADVPSGSGCSATSTFNIQFVGA